MRPEWAFYLASHLFFLSRLGHLWQEEHKSNNLDLLDLQRLFRQHARYAAGKPLDPLGYSFTQDNTDAIGENDEL